MSNAEALTAHIRNLNAEAVPGQLLLEEDPEFWKRCYDGRVPTVDEWERDQLAQMYSDMYKSEYGIRPRWMNFSDATAAQVQAELDKLFAAIDQQREWEAEREAKEAAEKAKEQALLAACREVPKPLTHNPFASIKL